MISSKVTLIFILCATQRITLANHNIIIEVTSDDANKSIKSYMDNNFKTMAIVQEISGKYPKINEITNDESPESTNNIVNQLIIKNLGQIYKNKYQPTWESIDSRPIPNWYDEAKIGIFIHWGVFSVPSYRSEWFWSSWNTPNSSVSEFMKKNYKPGFTYQDFGSEFTAEFFDPDQWADILASSGAKYVVLTSKHHEGYTLWPSKYSFSWNSGDVGPKRDLVGDLANSIRKKYKDIRFGLYHSLFEWFNPLYVRDRENNFTTNHFATMKTLPELVEIVLKYKPEIIWSDGEWEAPAEYWKSREFLAWLYNDSPVKDTVIVNDRWCNTCLCQHGGYLTCVDRFNPGKFQKKKFENAFTLDSQSWGYRRNANLEDIMNITELISTILGTISFGGNVLINIGPTKEGTIIPIFQERLKSFGDFMKINGEAIYSSQPWRKCQNETNMANVTYAWYTLRPIATSPHNIILYATFLDWPINDQIYLSCVKLPQGTSVQLLGDNVNKINLNWSNHEKGIIVDLPRKSLTSYNWAWTLKLPNAS